MDGEGKKCSQRGAIETQSKDRTQSQAIKKAQTYDAWANRKKRSRQPHAFVRLLIQDVQSLLETALPFSNTVIF